MNIYKTLKNLDLALDTFLTLENAPDLEDAPDLTKEKTWSKSICLCLKQFLKKLWTHFKTPNRGQGAFSPIRMKKSPTIRNVVH